MLDQYNILLIDDDPDILESYQDLLQLEGYQVLALADPTTIIQQIPENWVGVIICDVLLPNTSGLTILNEVMNKDQQLPIIMVTGHGDIAMAVESIKKGASHFLEKPVSPEELLIQVEQLLKQRLQIIEHRQWQIKQLDNAFIGHSDYIKNLKSQLQKLANTTLPIFIWGEQGTGRHLAATCLHHLSQRKNSPIIRCECLENTPPNLTHLIEQTKNGTLILKNIHYLSTIEQQKLIQLFNAHHFSLIALSDCSLIELIQKQHIIPEIYYLFIYTELEILPLVKHRSDIADIFLFYVKQTCEKLNKEIIYPDKKLLQNLINKKWLGNIKELISVAELYAIGFLSHQLTEPIADLNHILPYSLDKQLEEYEKQIIENALSFYQGKINEVSTHLDIPRKKLYLRMKKYGIDKKSYKSIE